jgi:hypothetical protein
MPSPKKNMTFFAAAIGVVKSAKLAEIPTINLFTIAYPMLVGRK